MLSLKRLLIALILAMQTAVSIHAAEHELEQQHSETCHICLLSVEPVVTDNSPINLIFQISWVAIIEPEQLNFYLSSNKQTLHNRGPPASL